MNTNELKQPSLRLTDSEVDKVTMEQWGRHATCLLPAYRAYARAIERLTAERIVTRLEQACGPTAMPPRLIRGLWLDEVDAPESSAGQLESGMSDAEYISALEYEMNRINALLAAKDAEAQAMAAERDAALALADERLLGLEATGKPLDSQSAEDEPMAIGMSMFASRAEYEAARAKAMTSNAS